MLQSPSLAVQQNNQANQYDAASSSRRILGAIQTAANQTGVNFSYLLQKASQESSLNPNAKASSSSATGLYQFTQQTWLSMVKNSGAKYGLGGYADHIKMDSNGVAHVQDPAWRQAILNLRKDPVASAEMAGELDKKNLQTLQNNVDGKIGGTELYLAHFLGAGGASMFLNEMQADPKQSAADLLPEAADANPSVFYGKDGSARSLQQIYQHFAAKFDNSSSPFMVAGATPPSPATTTPSLPMTPITVASISPSNYMNSTSGASPVPPAATSASLATQGIKADGSSLMATMILAQMHGQSSMPASTGNKDSKHNHYAYDAGAAA